MRLSLGSLACVLVVNANSVIASRTTGSEGYGGYEVEELIEEIRSGRRSESKSGRHSHNQNETEFWGYVDVRPGAHMFYMLYLSSHADGYLQRPLIIWLQGGPGQSSCGYGNFELIGPRGLNFTARSTSWVREASVLFLDNPVGAGFSYVNESVGNYTTNIHEITDDLISFTRQFIDRFPQFSVHQTPIYMFGESYGGKYVSHFANRLYHEAAAGRIPVNVAGFSLGNSLISPIVQSMAYGEQLYQLSLIDEAELEEIQSTAAILKEQIDAGDYQTARGTVKRVLQLVKEKSSYVDLYNFLVFNKPAVPMGKRTSLENDATLYRVPLWNTQESDELMDFMNGPVRNVLGIIPPEVTWKPFNGKVHVALQDLMASAVYVVDDSLINTTLQVIIMQGQFDIICNTAGVMGWVQTLSWPGLDDYNSARRQTLFNPDTQLPEAFVKAHDRFKFYWILGAGHSVGKDSGPATYRILQRVLGNVDV